MISALKDNDASCVLNKINYRLEPDVLERQCGVHPVWVQSLNALILNKHTDLHTHSPLRNLSTFCFVTGWDWNRLDWGFVSWILVAWLTVWWMASSGQSCSCTIRFPFLNIGLNVRQDYQNLGFFKVFQNSDVWWWSEFHRLASRLLLWLNPLCTWSLMFDRWSAVFI